MDRKSFLKSSLLATATALLPGQGQSEPENRGYESMSVGFEHLPLNTSIMKNTVLHKANTRGLADHGWLKSRHTFSFAHYFDPERVQFGALRVLNDDQVAPGMGFGTHPHKNMEIISIPLEGDLEHKDSMGNTMVIKKHDVQIMSAGTGVYHSEYNRNKDKEVKFLQIWVLPKKLNIEPRYEQITFDPKDRYNKWQTIVSPEQDGSIWINQDAYFSLIHLDKANEAPYTIKQKGNGAYVFVLKGSLQLDDMQLEARDGLGIWDTASFTVKASEDAEVLVMEVPMVA